MPDGPTRNRVVRKSETDSLGALGAKGFGRGGGCVIDYGNPNCSKICDVGFSWDGHFLCNECSRGWLHHSGHMVYPCYGKQDEGIQLSTKLT